MPRRLTFLPLLSSVLYILSFPKFNLSALAWVALVPLSLYALRASPKQAFLHGWLAGTLAYAGLLYWIVVTFRAAHLSAGLGCFSLLLLAGYLGLYWGAWTFLLTKMVPGTISMSPKKWYLVPFFGAAGWVALEYLRTYLFSGFPWVLLADSQVMNLPLIQIASITGVYGVSFLLVLVNLAISQWHWRPMALAIAILSVNALYGASRLSMKDSDGSKLLNVALLQGNIDQYKKWDSSYIQAIQKTYEDLIDRAASNHPDLILWPETSVPGYLLQDPPLRAWLERAVKRSHTNHLVGAPVIHGNKAYNSAFSLTPEGSLSGEYAKKHLVPFGEIVPWEGMLGRVIPVLNELGGFAAGTNSPLLKIAGATIGVNICYEAIFPNLVRLSVREGAELIANLTNDGWYMETSAPYQHWAPNIYRAIENDRWVLRADNTGISGIIDPKGRVTVASGLYTSAVLHDAVERRTQQTLYTRTGDVFALICVLFSLAGLILFNRKLTSN